jgi:hypothetical protein
LLSVTESYKLNLFSFDGKTASIRIQLGVGRGEITRCISMGFWIGLAIVATIVAFLAVWIIAAMRKVAKLVSPSRD